jgi:crotonobetainyl-CoA:carnitine CoA-transferase CaiB-like acyl-CoA transferase
MRVAPLEPSGSGGAAHFPPPRRSEAPIDDARDLPLSDVRVADFSRVLAGPLATMVLADLGADVVKIERPDGGDDTRAWGPPFVGGDAAYFLSLNRNKRSVVIDLGTDEGADAARRLALGADVVVENFRPGVMARFGLDHDSLSREKAEVITCSLTAFGEDAEDPTRPGYDIIVQALSGVMSFTGEPDGEPTKVGVALLDVICGLYASNAILAALAERERTGRGRHVSVSLFDASVAALVNQGANHLLGGAVPARLGNAHPNIVPYGSFRASDRSFILAAGNDRLFERTCAAIGREDLPRDERFATNAARVRNRDALIPLLEAAFASRRADEWLEALAAAGVPCAPIRSVGEVFASDEGARTIQTVEDAERGPLRLVADPIRVDGERLPARRSPPRLGEHTDEVLAELDER